MGIPHSVLDQFKQNHSEQSDLMREMLKEWLKTSDEPPPTWEAVVRALKSPSVKEISIAARLESKYCIPVQRKFVLVLQLFQIMAYGSTPYVGMTRKKNGGHIKSAQMTRSKCLHRSVNGLHEPYQALSSTSMGNRTVNLLESIAKVPDWQSLKRAKSSSSSSSSSS